MSIDVVAPQVLALSDQERAERLLRFQRAWLAYDGEASEPYAREVGEPNDNVRLNFNRLLVDKGVSFLFGKTISWGVDGEATDGEEADPAEDALTRFWRANGGMPWWRKLAKNGGVTGHAFAKLQPGAPTPRAIVLDPSNCEPEWDDEDIDKLVRFVIEWLTFDRDTEKVITRRQTIEPEGSRWVIIDEVSRESGDRWEEIDRNAHPFEWCPIFHCQNLEAPNEFWGTADLECDVLDLVESIEKVVSDMKRVVRLYGHPKVWVTGGTFGEIDASIDAALEVASAEAKIGQLQLSSELEGPLRYYRELKSALHEVARIPEVATGKVENIGNLSGVALQILYQPLLEKTEEKRDSYGDLGIDLSGRALEMMGVGGDRTPTITWPEMLPADPQVELATLDAAQAMGVISNQTISERLGLDFEQEQRRLAEEAENAPEPPNEPEIPPGV